MSVEALVAAAKGWRQLAKLTVLLLGDGGGGVGEGAAEGRVTEVPVKLGETRRRWKRVAQAIEPMASYLVGARGYDAKGELVGAWDAPEEVDDDGDGHVVAGETDAMAGHRTHTQWVLREASKIHEVNTRLTIELVAAVIEVIRRVATPSVQPAEPQAPDEATKTLGMLLQMASQNNNRSADDEAERDDGRPRSDADRQGQPEQPNQAGT